MPSCSQFISDHWLIIYGLRYIIDGKPSKLLNLNFTYVQRVILAQFNVDGTVKATVFLFDIWKDSTKIAIDLLKMWINPHEMSSNFMTGWLYLKQSIFNQIFGKNHVPDREWTTQLFIFIFSGKVQQTYQVLYSFAYIYTWAYLRFWFQEFCNHCKSNERNSQDLSTDFRNRWNSTSSHFQISIFVMSFNIWKNII